MEQLIRVPSIEGAPVKRRLFGPSRGGPLGVLIAVSAGFWGIVALAADILR
ncbi:MAG: hypothetical protein PGN09_02230 [Sphingomonas fennica]